MLRSALLAVAAAAILILAGHAAAAAARQSGLPASQRRGPIDVGHDRLRRLYRTLGGKYGHFQQPPPPKPKWMRWRTYERLLAEIAATEGAHNAVFIAGAKRFLARCGRPLQ